jgi:hypothetical protein
MQFPNITTGIDPKALSGRLQDTKLSSKMVAGYSIDRPQTTRRVREFDISYKNMPESEKEIIRQFEKDNFALPFDFILPGGEVVTVKIAGVIDFKATSTTLYWNVNFKLEEQ